MPTRKQLAIPTLVLILATLNALAAERMSGRQALGVVVGAGSISVDHQPALPSTAFFAGDVVSTGAGSTAVMRFPSGINAMLAGNSEVALPEDQARASMVLRRGTVLVRTANGASLRVGVQGASVIVQGEENFPAICRVTSVGRAAAIFADKGHVEVHGAGAPLILPPGKHLELAAGRPVGAGQAQGAGQIAGKVNNAIPEEVVQHQGQTTEAPLRLNELVNWQDLVRTMRTGRVRIQLLDGSALNIGARSTMRIIKHDPQSQQSEVELTVGRLRGEVVKIKSGGSFQLRTQTAVIGVVGTTLLLHATAKFTRAFSIDGPFTARNIDPRIVGTVTVHTGEFTTIPRGLPPTGAVKISPGRMQAETSHTNVQGPAPGQAGQVGLGRTAVSTGVKGATLGAEATGAALTGATVAKIGSAQDSLAAANADLATAITQSNAAKDAANNALNTATNFGTAVIKVVSAATPGCGCQ